MLKAVPATATAPAVAWAFISKGRSEALLLCDAAKCTPKVRAARHVALQGATAV